jgi:hypothetical protein
MKNNYYFSIRIKHYFSETDSLKKITLWSNIKILQVLLCLVVKLESPVSKISLIPAIMYFDQSLLNDPIYWQKCKYRKHNLPS